MEQVLLLFKFKIRVYTYLYDKFLELQLLNMIFTINIILQWEVTFGRATVEQLLVIEKYAPIIFIENRIRLQFRYHVKQWTTILVKKLECMQHM